MKRAAKQLTCVVAMSTIFGVELSAQQVLVGPNVQVSKARPSFTHAELWADGDPNNPDRLIACSVAAGLDAKGVFAGLEYYVSHDRGLSWRHSREVHGGADPWCAFGPGGVAYGRMLEGMYNEDRSRTRANGRFLPSWKLTDLVIGSPDGGLTWKTAAPVPLVDRPMIAVDNTGGRFHGRVYMMGALRDSLFFNTMPRRSRLGLSRSEDGGKSYVMTERGGDGFVNVEVGPAILSDGSLLIPATVLVRDMSGVARPGGERAYFGIMRSSDGGVTVGPPITIPDLLRREYATLAVNPSAPFRDRLYVAYADSVDGEAGSTRNPRLGIRLIYSDDKGVSWSAPQTIDDAKSNPDGSHAKQMHRPVVRVNKEGAVGVSWYAQDLADPWSYEHRFTASFDGGVTFTPSVRVSSVSNSYKNESIPTDRRIAVYALPRGGRIPFSAYGWYGRVKDDAFGGDYNGMAVGADGTFHPIWVDNRTGIKQIWTAPVTVRGTIARNGSQELSQFADISRKLEVTVSSAILDRSTGVVVATVKLRNVSAETLSGPMKFRLTSAATRHGRVETRGADNGVTGPGAVWDFSALMRDGKLEPQEESRGREITLVMPLMPRTGHGQWVPELKYQILAPGSE